jgi:hemerythrin-like metal-binding protein
MISTKLHWDDSFLIGIDELDYEHKILLGDINRFHEELMGQEEKSEIERCLGEIYSRMQSHFALEEHVMKENDYPYYNEHKKEHEKLLDTYTEYMVQFLNDSGSSPGIRIDENLKNWIIDHIRTSDKKMSQMVHPN